MCVGGSRLDGVRKNWPGAKPHVLGDRAYLERTGQKSELAALDRIEGKVPAKPPGSTLGSSAPASSLAPRTTAPFKGTVISTTGGSTSSVLGG